jgi:hypothetical protein
MTLKRHNYNNIIEYGKNLCNSYLYIVLTSRWIFLLPLNHINNNKNNTNDKIHSERLLDGLTNLNGLLGKVLIQSIINSLKHHGVDVTDKSKFYSMNDIQVAFDKMFGPDGSQLLVERLEVQLSGSLDE